MPLVRRSPPVSAVWPLRRPRLPAPPPPRRPQPRRSPPRPERPTQLCECMHGVPPLNTHTHIHSPTQAHRYTQTHTHPLIASHSVRRRRTARCLCRTTRGSASSRVATAITTSRRRLGALTYARIHIHTQLLANNIIQPHGMHFIRSLTPDAVSHSAWRFSPE